MNRHFSEEEAREVFARAAERQHTAVAKGEGLSLDELRTIGAEAGLDPAHVEAAARAVALGEPETGRTSFGPLPRGVFRTVVLPGPPSDALWSSIVADARRTFSAQGKLSGAGGIREWRNSNLRISLEPEGDGARLHLQTRRTDRTQLTASLAGLAVVMALVAVFTSLDFLTNGGNEILPFVMTAVGAGLGALGMGAEQRRWADRREQQFDEVARRAAEAQAAEARPAVDSREPASRIDASLLDGDTLDAPAAADRRSRTR